MVKEAESHAEEDRKRHVSVELRSKADNLPYREATPASTPTRSPTGTKRWRVACQR
jgi:hypothetical protein